MTEPREPTDQLGIGATDMTDNTQPDALRLADEVDEVARTYPDMAEVSAELRRQHARIAELEAQLEAIGAGGVSGPLMGCADSKEREAFERALMDLAAQHGETVSTSDLSRDASGAYDNGMTEIAWMLWQARASLAASEPPEGITRDDTVHGETYFTAADMASASAQGFRDGVASVAANAGSEPVAWRYVPSKVWGDKVFTDDPVRADDARQAGCIVDPLYTHHSPPEGMVGGWIALPGALPEPGTPVLLDIGKKYPIRAMWAAKFTLLVSLEDDSGFGEHDERTDEWYCTEGWHEWNEHEETHWAVSSTPIAWAHLPPTSFADSRKGE